MGEVECFEEWAVVESFNEFDLVEGENECVETGEFLKCSDGFDSIVK